MTSAITLLQRPSSGNESRTSRSHPPHWPILCFQFHLDTRHKADAGTFLEHLRRRWRPQAVGQWFRAFTKFPSRHVALPSPENLPTAYDQSLRRKYKPSPGLLRLGIFSSLPSLVSHGTDDCWTFKVRFRCNLSFRLSEGTNTPSNVTVSIYRAGHPTL